MMQSAHDIDALRFIKGIINDISFIEEGFCIAECLKSCKYNKAAFSKQR